MITTYRISSMVFGLVPLVALACSSDKTVKAEGDAIISAIDRYKLVNNGALPSSIAQLTPVYLKSSPRLKWQYSVRVSATGAVGFVLTSGEGGFTFRQYDSISGGWVNPSPAD